MGGRQSSQNNRNSQTAAVRHSISSLDNASGSRVGGFFASPSGSIDLANRPTDRSVHRWRRRRDRNDLLIEAHSLPPHLFPALIAAEIKCPVCNKRIGSDEIESHLLACLSRPRVSYNEDILKADAGECIICFDDMITGDHIARLPCLCIYHKKCLDDWFQKNRCCPEHPDQVPQEFTETPSEDIPITVATETTNTETADVLVTTTSSIVTTSNSTAIASVSGASNSNYTASASISRVSASNYITADDTLVTVTSTAPVSTNESLHLTNEQNILTDYESNNELSNNENNTPVEIVGREVAGYNELDAEVAEIEEPDASLCLLDDILQVNDETDVMSSVSRNSQPNELSIAKKVTVHVDEGSLHGSQTLFDEEEMAQLTSKIKTIYVAESPHSSEVDNA